MATKTPIEDPMIDPRTGEYAVIAPGHNFKSVTQKIAGIVLTSNTPLGWFFGLIVASGVAMGVVVGCTWLFLKGVGIWGVTIPGAWGFAIIRSSPTSTSARARPTRPASSTQIRSWHNGDQRTHARPDRRSSD